MPTVPFLEINQLGFFKKTVFLESRAKEAGMINQFTR
jgi:hypothetical protein